MGRLAPISHVALFWAVLFLCPKEQLAPPQGQQASAAKSPGVKAVDLGQRGRMRQRRIARTPQYSTCKHVAGDETAVRRVLWTKACKYSPGYTTGMDF